MESELTSKGPRPILGSHVEETQPTPPTSPQTLTEESRVPAAAPRTLEERTFRISLGPTPELLHYLKLGYRIVAVSHPPRN